MVTNFRVHWLYRYFCPIQVHSPWSKINPHTSRSQHIQPQDTATTLCQTLNLPQPIHLATWPASAWYYLLLHGSNAGLLDLGIFRVPYSRTGKVVMLLPVSTSQPIFTPSTGPLTHKSLSWIPLVIPILSPQYFSFRATDYWGELSWKYSSVWMQPMIHILSFEKLNNNKKHFVWNCKILFSSFLYNRDIDYLTLVGNYEELLPNLLTTLTKLAASIF